MAVSQRVRKVLRWTGWGLGALAALGVIVLLVFVLVIWPQLESSAHDKKPFWYDKKMAIEKLAPDGTPYTVNNSTATFRLDVAKPDAHSRLVFTNYAAALAYCRERGLPTLPSVQLIQGKLKQRRRLCAALEWHGGRGCRPDAAAGGAQARREREEFVRGDGARAGRRERT
jgi:hypothetical protein